MTDQKPYAVVTGASSGIGRELAKLFAENGYDLLVCAEDEGLQTAAAELESLGAEVTAVRRDLRTPEAVEELYAAIVATGRPVAAAAVNAGVGRGGAFVDTPLADLREIVDLNVASTMHLAHLLLGDMVGRNVGRVLLTSSIASTMPGSYAAVYNASKSFVQSLAEALQNELKDTDVTVTSLMPGPTETNFFHRAQMDDTALGQAKKDDPAAVARQGFDALLAGEHRVVAASVKTEVQEAAAKILPDPVKSELHRRMAEPQDPA